jgi:hypothetical protein
MSALTPTNEKKRFILILSILLIINLSGTSLIVAPAQAMPPANTYTVPRGGSYSQMVLKSVSLVHLEPIDNPAPTITNLSPSSTYAGMIGFTLNVYGTNFINTSTVLWNGVDRLTTYVSATRLTISISAADIASGGNVTVTVFNPAPGGGISNGVTFTINNPVPTVANLTPNSASAGGAPFTLTVNGTNFVNTSVVRWNGADRTTTYVSGTQLTASITAADILSVGSATVTVFNPAPMGGTSIGLSFSIVPASNYVFLPVVMKPASPNQPPTDIQLSNSTIAEDQPIHTLVGMLSTTDPNAGDTFTYSLVSGSGSTDNASFYILENQLRTLAVFDYEIKSSYSIRIRTTDQGGLFYEKPFTITVTLVTQKPLLNGDFEQGHVDWYEDSTHSPKLIMQYGVDSLPVPPQSGNWAVWLGGYPSDISYIQQTVTVPSGSPYISFWYWIDSIDICNYDFGYFRVDGVDLETYNLCYPNNTNGWVHRVINMSAYVGDPVTIQIKTVTDPVTNSNLFIDNVTFQSSP